METQQPVANHPADKAFVQDANFGIALQLVTADNFNQFIEDTREDVRLTIEYSYKLGAVILAEDFAVEGGLSMRAIIEELEEIEEGLKEDPTGLLRFYRAITVTAASLNMPIPARMIVIDVVTQTAVSLLNTSANLKKKDELAQRIAEAKKAHADVEELRGEPGTTQSEEGNGDVVAAALIEVADKLIS